MSTLLRVISSSPILGWVDDMFDKIIEIVIGPILWGLCDIFFLILDMFESLYRKFAGLEEITLGGVTSTGDPVLFLINSDIIQEVFFSILILSLFLLVIFTIFAVVKNIYVEKPKPVMEIINKSVKALLLYLLVPIATIVCLLVGNVVLVAIDGATKIGGASSTSDMLFLSASYNASKLRDESDEDKLENLEYMLNHKKLWLSKEDSEAKTKFKQTMSDNGITVNDDGSGSIQSGTEIDWEVVASAVDEAYVAGVIANGQKWYLGIVTDFYHILQINLLIVWVGGAFMIWAMGKITWGLLSRLFKMTLFFALSPAVMATMPIDDGKALKSWTGEMVKNGTMAYCAIGVLNVLYSILPAFGQLKLFGNNFLLNGLARLFIYIVAFSSAEKLIGTISGWFGTGDAMAEGKATAGQIKAAKDKVTKGSKKALGTLGAYMGGRKAAKDQGEGQWGTFIGGLQGAFSQSGFAKMQQDTQKTYQDGKKGGQDYYKDSKTKGWTGEVNKEKLAAYEDHELINKLQTKYKGATGNEWNPSQEALEMSEAALGAEHVWNPAAYKARMRHNKEILEIDDYGEKVYFREEKMLKQREEDHAKEVGYNTEFTNVERLQARETEARNRYNEALNNAIGGDITSFSTDIQNEIIQHLQNGDKDALEAMRVAAVASSDTALADSLNYAINNMTDQMVTNLNSMNEFSNQASEATAEAVARLQESIDNDQDKREFAIQYGLVGESAQLDSAALNDLNTNLAALKISLDSNSDSLKSQRAHLTNQKAAASSRHLSGTATAADRAAVKDYNDGHPST